MRINTLRGTSLIAENAVKTHCLRGHELNTQNTQVYKRHRSCRICKRMRKARYIAKKKGIEANRTLMAVYAIKEGLA